jgi:hypothetical protein
VSEKELLAGKDTIRIRIEDIVRLPKLLASCGPKSPKIAVRSTSDPTMPNVEVFAVRSVLSCELY